MRKPITPINSPNKEKYGDRFIPSRAGNNWQVNFNMIQQDKNQAGLKKTGRDAGEGSKDYSLLVYSSLLKNEVLGAGIEDFKEANDERRALAPLSEGKKFIFIPTKATQCHQRTQLSLLIVSSLLKKSKTTQIT